MLDQVCDEGLCCERQAGGGVNGDDIEGEEPDILIDTSIYHGNLTRR